MVNIYRRGKCRGFPCSSVGKESACSAGDLSSVTGLGRSPGERNGNPLQYPCLKNPMDRGVWGCKRVGCDLATYTHTQRHGAFCWPVGILKQVYICLGSPCLSSYCPSVFLPPLPYWITMLTLLQTWHASKPFLKLLPLFKMQNSAFKLGVPPGLPQTILSPVLFTWPAYPYLPQVSEPLLVSAAGSSKTLDWINETS